MRYNCLECGNHYEYKQVGSKGKKYCSAVCGARAWRKTDKGKAYTTKYNKRYKRPDIAQVCAICGQGYTSARVRDICDKPACQAVAQGFRRAKMWSKNPDMADAYRYIDSLRKKINRGTLTRPYCSVCGVSERVQWHHPDYSKPLYVIPLCHIHHREWHNKQKIKSFSQLCTS